MSVENVVENLARKILTLCTFHMVKYEPRYGHLCIAFSSLFPCSNPTASKYFFNAGSCYELAIYHYKTLRVGF